MDIMNFWGRTRAIVSIGYGMTTLDEVLAAEAAKQGRIVLPDPESEKGYFYRSDHFELAKLGVPALHFLHPGADYRDRPPDYGQRMRDRYTTQGYHKVTDEVRADWDLSGAVEDAHAAVRRRPRGGAGQRLPGMEARHRVPRDPRRQAEGEIGPALRSFEEGAQAEVDAVSAVDAHAGAREHRADGRLEHEPGGELV